MRCSPPPCQHELSTAADAHYRAVQGRHVVARQQAPESSAMIGCMAGDREPKRNGGLDPEGIATLLDQMFRLWIEPAIEERSLGLSRADVTKALVVLPRRRLRRFSSRSR